MNPVSAGITVKDGTSVTGSRGTATGNVTFLFYQSINGTGIAIGAGTVPLNSSGVAKYSNVEGPLAVGSYSFVAVYNGDTHYLPSASAVEPLIVQAAQPNLTTTQNPARITLSGTTPPVLIDSASLSQGYIPTGTINFTLYAPGGTTVVDSETVT